MIGIFGAARGALFRMRFEASRIGSQHPRVGGDVDRNADRLDVVCGQSGLETVKRIVVAGHDTKLGRIHRCEIEVRRQAGKELLLSERDTQHSAGGNLGEQPAAQMHEFDGIS